MEPSASWVLRPSASFKVSHLSGPELMIDVPDLGYVTSSDPPQGEIWLRGANIFKG
jgi:hypothetical protein